MSTLPFKQTTHGGFAEVTGLLRIEERALCVDFEIADAITGILKSNVKVVIPQDQIADVHYNNGLIGGKICIRVRDMDVLQQIPWREGAEFQVSVRRRDRGEAKNFAEELSWFAD